MSSKRRRDSNDQSTASKRGCHNRNSVSHFSTNENIANDEQVFNGDNNNRSNLDDTTINSNIDNGNSNLSLIIRNNVTNENDCNTTSSIDSDEDRSITTEIENRCYNC